MTKISAQQILTDKKTRLFIILSGIFITNAIIAEMIGGKIFSFERTLGYEPLNTPLWGDYILQFNLTAGVLLWPVVFITTDIINEYYGKKGVRRITFITVGLIAYAFLAIYMAMKLAPADFWLEVNATDANGAAINIDEAFRLVLTQGLNRQIRRMCEHLGYRVTKLKRVRIMNINLDLPLGDWRDLKTHELKELRRLCETSSKTNQ